MWTEGQVWKYWEKSSALRVALIKMIFRSDRCNIRSFRTKSRKSLGEREGWGAKRGEERREREREIKGGGRKGEKE